MDEEEVKPYMNQQYLDTKLLRTINYDAMRGLEQAVKTVWGMCTLIRINIINSAKYLSCIILPACCAVNCIHVNFLQTARCLY